MNQHINAPIALIMTFTVEEINLIAIYKADTLAATITGIDDALPDMYDEDIITISESAIRKLSALSDSDFNALTFDPADDTETEPDEADNGEGGAYAEAIKESTA